MNTAIHTLKTPSGHTLTTITYRGEPCWIAQEVGAALGYAQNGKRLSTKITGAWSNEAIEGVDFWRIEGDELADLKRALVQLDTDPVSSPVGANTKSLILLTERGIWLACLKTNKPAGVELRRWLASEVLPALRRGELVTPPLMTMEERRQAVQEARTWMRIADKGLETRAIDHVDYVEALRQAAAHTRSVLADRLRPHPSMPAPQLVLALPAP